MYLNIALCGLETDTVRIGELSLIGLSFIERFRCIFEYMDSCRYAVQAFNCGTMATIGQCGKKSEEVAFFDKSVRRSSISTIIQSLFYKRHCRNAQQNCRIRTLVTIIQPGSVLGKYFMNVIISQETCGVLCRNSVT